MEHFIQVIEKQENYTPPQLLAKAMKFMRENLHREITRDETARYAGISPSHFSHVLKERTGRSFTELLRQCRIDLACTLLTKTEQPLAAVADACGFCDQSYFTRVFRDIKGATPREYRLQSGKRR